MGKWTRQQIIQEILKREAAGLPLYCACRQGLSTRIYRAGCRIFGSWPNALMAAGLTPELANPRAYWQPARVLSAIRALARMELRPGELNRRHGNVLKAAHRCFGSWSRAVLAAGVDPQHFRSQLRWSRERIIEAILTRELCNQPLNRQAIRPTSLVEASVRQFGSWDAALAAAGVAIKKHGRRHGTGQTSRRGPTGLGRTISRPGTSPRAGGER